MLEMRGSSKLKNLNAQEVEAMRVVCKVRLHLVYISSPSPSTPTYPRALPALALPASRLTRSLARLRLARSLAARP